MVMRSLFKAEAAITAWPRTRFVQVDKYLGVAKRPSSPITNSLPPVHNTDGLVLNQLYCTQWAGLELHECLLKART